MNASPQTQSITLGGGCFWCLDAAFRRIAGVTSVVSGYAGGHWPDPTYERVCSGTTGHAQVIQVSFDPAVITLADVLDIFWTIHNPTTLNRQDYDQGTQYRSIILYHDAAQEPLVQASRDAVAKLWPDPVVTEIVPLEHFYPAEDYHQDYYRKHPEQAYCQIIINPKLVKLREKFQTRLKTTD